MHKSIKTLTCWVIPSILILLLWAVSYRASDKSITDLEARNKLLEDRLNTAKSNIEWYTERTVTLSTELAESNRRLGAATTELEEVRGRLNKIGTGLEKGIGELQLIGDRVQRIDKLADLIIEATKLLQNSE